MSFSIKSYPLPPSVNNLYSTIGHNSMRRVKSKEYVKYQQRVKDWVALNLPQVRLAREVCARISGTQTVLHVNATFYMFRKSVLCKDGRPKRNDTSNRLKALHDSLSEFVLGLDDSYFWSGAFFKVAIEEARDVEWVDIDFVTINPGGSDDGSGEGAGSEMVKASKA